MLVKGFLWRPQVICTYQLRIQDFPEGGANSQSGCTNLLFCIFFCRKLHENERIWTPSQACPWRPLGSPNAYCSNWKLFTVTQRRKYCNGYKNAREDPGWEGSLHPKFDFLKKKLVSLIFLTMVFAVVVTSPKYFPSLFHMTEMTTTVKLAKAVMTRQDL